MNSHIRLRLTLPLIWLIACIGCGEDSPPVTDIVQPTAEPQFGAVSGIVTDAKTGNPIPGVSVTLLDQTTETEADGRYVFTQVAYAEGLSLTVTAADYEPKTQGFSLNVERLTLNVAITPLTDPGAEITEFFDTLSALIESQDMDNLDAIQSHFSPDYLASADPVTDFGVGTGVIPASFEKVIPAMSKLFEEFDGIQFQFNDIQIDVTHAQRASSRVNLNIITEQGPRPDRTEIVAECRIDFRKEETEWKAIFWQLFTVDILL